MFNAPKRRGSGNNASVARAHGFYTRGKLKYKLREGDPLPTQFDDIFYYGDNGVEQEKVVTAEDVVAERIIEDENAIADEYETASEDGSETPETPKRRSSRRKVSNT